MGALLNELNSKDSLTHYQKRNVQLSLEDYNRNKKLSSDFVRKMSETVTTTYHAWVKPVTIIPLQVFRNLCIP